MFLLILKPAQMFTLVPRCAKHSLFGETSLPNIKLYCNVRLV